MSGPGEPRFRVHSHDHSQGNSRRPQPGHPQGHSHIQARGDNRAGDKRKGAVDSGKGYDDDQIRPVKLPRRTLSDDVTRSGTRTKSDTANNKTYISSRNLDSLTNGNQKGALTNRSLYPVFNSRRLQPPAELSSYHTGVSPESSHVVTLPVNPSHMTSTAVSRNCNHVTMAGALTPAGKPSFLYAILTGGKLPDNAFDVFPPSDNLLPCHTRPNHGEGERGSDLKRRYPGHRLKGTSPYGGDRCETRVRLTTQSEGHQVIPSHGTPPQPACRKGSAIDYSQSDRDEEQYGPLNLSKTQVNRDPGHGTGDRKHMTSHWTNVDDDVTSLEGQSPSSPLSLSSYCDKGSSIENHPVDLSVHKVKQTLAHPRADVQPLGEGKRSNTLGIHGNVSEVVVIKDGSYDRKYGSLLNPYPDNQHSQTTDDHRGDGHSHGLRHDHRGDGHSHGLRHDHRGDGHSHGLRHDHRGDGHSHGLRHDHRGDGHSHGLRHDHRGDGHSHGLRHDHRGDGHSHGLRHDHRGDGHSHGLRQTTNGESDRNLLKVRSHSNPRSDLHANTHCDLLVNSHGDLHSNHHSDRHDNHHNYLHDNHHNDLHSNHHSDRHDNYHNYLHDNHHSDFCPNGSKRNKFHVTNIDQQHISNEYHSDLHSNRYHDNHRETHRQSTKDYYHSHDTDLDNDLQFPDIQFHLEQQESVRQDGRQGKWEGEKGGEREGGRICESTVNMDKLDTDDKDWKKARPVPGLVPIKNLLANATAAEHLVKRLL